jgi:hypothetical protein
MANTSVFLGRASVATTGPITGDGSIGDPLTIPADATLTTPDIGDATGTSLVLSGDMKAATYHSGATAGLSAGPFTVITGIRTVNGLVTVLTGS